MSVAFLEPWLDLKQLSQQTGMSERWLKYRLAEGMPSALFGSRRKMRQTECEAWLEAHGWLRKDGAE